MSEAMAPRQPMQLAIHYDPDTLRSRAFRDWSEAGRCAHYGTFGISSGTSRGINPPAAGANSNRTVSELPGVLEAEVSRRRRGGWKFDVSSIEGRHSCSAGRAGVGRKSETHRHEADRDHRHGGNLSAPQRADLFL